MGKGYRSGREKAIRTPATAKQTKKSRFPHLLDGNIRRARLI